ncbi:MAG: hypothetical protein ACERIG_00590 [Hyphomicrobium sp.]
MSALSTDTLPMTANRAKPGPLGSLLLARVACAGGATRAQLVRDLGPFVSSKLSPAELRSTIDTELTRLLSAGLVRNDRSRYRASEAGADATARFLREKESHARAWSEQRDIWLVAKVLGVDAAKPGIRTALTRPEGLNALIVQSSFGLNLRQALSPSKLRAALALLALERAFGNNVKSGLNRGAALSAKAGRVLAGQLLQNPREVNTDARLVSMLSAEQVGATRADIEIQRLALLKRLAAGALKEQAQPTPKHIAPTAANGAARSAPKAVKRPGLAQFSAGVLVAARSHAQGWSGSRKAFISQVWQAIRTSHPDWGLSEIEFKDMLAGAHRAGQVVLASADLKEKQNLKDFEESAISYKNTVWYFVRVDD